MTTTPTTSAPTTTARAKTGRSNEILVGDAATIMRKMASQSVEMILTSPPYHRLREYGSGPEEIGTEYHVDEWVAALHAVAKEAMRVLAPEGTMWLNLGDTYSPGPGHGAPRKSLLMGPERLALRLIADGWILRNKTIWAKKNHLPHPVADRLTNAWEYIYVFARAPRYHFDLDAIRVPHRSKPPKPKPDYQAAPGERARLGSKGLKAMHAAGRIGHPLGKNPGDVWHLPTSQYRGAHRATMPLELARRAIAAACPKLRPDGTPGVVLDPFMGSGTTAIAAQALGRDWVGIELNPEYAQLARQRIANDPSPEGV